MATAEGHCRLSRRRRTRPDASCGVRRENVRQDGEQPSTSIDRHDHGGSWHRTFLAADNVVGYPVLSTKGEREDLIKLIKGRERVQKTAAQERSKELLAQFEQHLGTIFKYDRDEVWKAANKAANEAVAKASGKQGKRRTAPL